MCPQEPGPIVPNDKTLENFKILNKKYLSIVRDLHLLKEDTPKAKGLDNKYATLDPTKKAALIIELENQQEQLLNEFAAQVDDKGIIKPVDEMNKTKEFNFNPDSSQYKYANAKYMENFTGTPKSKPSVTFGKMARAFFSPFIAPARDFSDVPLIPFAVYSLMLVIPVAGAVFAGICTIKGLYNMVNTVRNGADYHPFSGRSNANRGEEMLRREGEKGPLSPDQGQLRFNFNEAKTLASSKVDRYVNSVVDKIRMAKQQSASNEIHPMTAPTAATQAAPSKASSDRAEAVPPHPHPHQ